MRTLSAKPAKGEEPPRTLGDDLQLLRMIVTMGWEYLLGEGRRVRKRFYARQRRGEKFYVDET